MADTEHTWLFQPGTWTAEGRLWEYGTRERPLHGRSVVRHERKLWEIEGEMEVLGEEPVRLTNTYRLAPPRVAGEVLPWLSENPALGTLSGVFTVAGDAILSFFRSADGGYAGSETMTRLAPDRYRAWGILTADGSVLSTWAVELARAE